MGNARTLRISVGLAVLTTLSSVGLITGTAPSAQALISVSPQASSAFGKCMKNYRAEDESGDPLNIVRYLEFNPHNVKIVLNNGAPQDPGDSFTRPADDDWADAQNGSGTDSVIAWNSTDTRPMSDGPRRDPCAQLYHEMAHALDMARGTLNLHWCRGAPRIQTDEVVAVFAENAYRSYRNLPTRTAYGTESGPAKLPDSVDDC
ncbi:M91 family zinc metallopeptidase [Streptomyces misionensis]|uniref:M91 family zinc metallopeptidase n=2 Tax=Streptomyces misionensis TaxID=67331 RepID=UPI0033A6AE0E